jgi:hypothetical protein
MAGRVLLDRIKFLKKYHRFFDIMGRYNIERALVVIWLQPGAFLCILAFSITWLSIYCLPFHFFEMMIRCLYSSLSSRHCHRLICWILAYAALPPHLFLYITNQQIAIIAAVSSIWLINLIIPAIIGSVFVFKMKFFDRTV